MNGERSCRFTPLRIGIDLSPPSAIESEPIYMPGAFDLIEIHCSYGFMALPQPEAMLEAIAFQISNGFFSVPFSLMTYICGVCSTCV